MRLLLLIHMLLVVLASTSFTALTFFRDGSWSVEFYKLGYSSGFGKSYQSPYSETVILTYIAAFLFGLAGYIFVMRSGARWPGAIGILVSALGIYCFVNEFFQLEQSVYNSRIAVYPLFMLALAIYSLIPRNWFQTRRNAGEKHAPAKQ